MESGGQIRVSYGHPLAPPDAPMNLPAAPLMPPDASLLLPASPLTPPDTPMHLPASTLTPPDAPLPLPASPLTSPDASMPLPAAPLTPPDIHICVQPTGVVHSAEVVRSVAIIYRGTYRGRSGWQTRVSAGHRFLRNPVHRSVAEMCRDHGSYNKSGVC